MPAQGVDTKHDKLLLDFRVRVWYIHHAASFFLFLLLLGTRDKEEAEGRCINIFVHCTKYLCRYSLSHTKSPKSCTKRFVHCTKVFVQDFKHFVWDKLYMYKIFVQCTKISVQIVNRQTVVTASYHRVLQVWGERDRWRWRLGATKPSYMREFCDLASSLSSLPSLDIVSLCQVSLVASQ